MSEPDEDGNYTEEEWDNLPVAYRMRLCASGQYEVYPSDMTDAADRIEKLEARVLLLEGYLNGALNVVESFVACDTKQARKALEGKDETIG